MEQVTIGDILAQEGRLAVRHIAGPLQSAAIHRVEVAAVDDLGAGSPGSLVIATGFETEVPQPYEMDIAIRRAIASRFSALIFIGDFALAETAKALAGRAGIPVLMTDTNTASELAMLIDRIVQGGAVEALSRAEYAIERVTETAATSTNATQAAILAAASSALGIEVTFVPDPTATWTERDAVCVGEVPIGRLTSASTDASIALALPVIASVLSRALERELHDRFAQTRSRADLIIELIFAESSRIDGFAAEATRAGLPLQLSHVVAWLKPTHLTDPDRRPSRLVQSSIELFALQLIDQREELWHLTTIHDDVVIVASEEIGAADHQRRLRDVIEKIVAHASAAAGPEWVFTVGLGTPQVAASGLRQSAAEARIAAEAAIAGGRLGAIEVTDVTGLRRVLLDFYASPLSRKLLSDILAPLEALGPERAATSIRTLASYIGHRNSLVRAGEELNLHANAVNYRIRRIEQALDLDLNDPDVRFALELACRVWLISPNRH